MKEIDILGSNRFDSFSKTRIGCRGIVIRDGRILVSREEKTDYWLIPGGGIEMNESLEACCAREILEETGYIVKPLKRFLVLNEYYEEYKYISHYFECQIIGTDHQQLTDEEAARGLIPKWLDIREFVEIVAKNEEYASTDEEKRGTYLREYTAINEYIKYKNGA